MPSAQDKEGEVLEFFGCHLAVEPCFLIKFGAAARGSSIADCQQGCARGKRLREEHSAVVKEVVLVRYCRFVESRDFSFYWVARLAPFCSLEIGGR